jgi:hypothetical protein
MAQSRRQRTFIEKIDNSARLAPQRVTHHNELCSFTHSIFVLTWIKAFCSASIILSNRWNGGTSQKFRTRFPLREVAKNDRHWLSLVEECGCGRVALRGCRGLADGIVGFGPGTNGTRAKRDAGSPG